MRWKKKSEEKFIDKVLVLEEFANVDSLENSDLFARIFVIIKLEIDHLLTLEVCKWSNPKCTKKKFD